MTKTIPAGVIVEVTDRGSNTFQYAVVVEQPTDRVLPNETDTFVWVRYENGCVVPAVEYNVRPLTNQQVVAELNKLVFPRS